MPHRKAIPIEDLDPELTDVSRQVIGAAIEVHKTLGPGFDLEIYEQALASELNDLSIPYELHHTFPVTYKGKPIGEQSLDMYVNNRFAVTLLSERREIDGLDRTTLRAKLRAADLELGLIINFAERRLKDGLVRVLNPDKLKLHPPGHDDHDEDEHEAPEDHEEGEPA